MTYITRMTALEAKATAAEPYNRYAYGIEDDEFHEAIRNSWPKLRRLIEACHGGSYTAITAALADLEGE